MDKFRDIPIVSIGPGSQPKEQDEGLEYMQMPSGMETYHQPVMPEPEELSDMEAAVEVLERVLQALRAWQPGQDVMMIDLQELSLAQRTFVSQALGEGEVSVSCEGLSPVQAQEAVLAGVWRVQHLDGNGELICDAIEIGDVPDCVRQATFADSDTELDTTVNDNDPMLQNSPALLVELAEQLRDYRPGQAPHTLNLSLLPLTEADVMLLGQRLGVGPVTILSRGYGNCRIGSTAKRNCWWIKYFNSQDVLILNSIEITSVPEVALAAAEDIHDSADRLDEILSLYR